MSESKASLTPTTVRGNYVVLGIFGIGVALGLFAWWWNLGQNRRCRELWGSENVRLIRQAQQVALGELSLKAAENTSDETLTIDGQVYHFANRRDISHARGLVHARYALTDDPSFEWSTSHLLISPKWEWAVRFTEANSKITLLMDTAGNRVRVLETGREAEAIPRIIAGWRTLLLRESDAQDRSR